MHDSAYIAEGSARRGDLNSAPRSRSIAENEFSVPRLKKRSAVAENGAGGHSAGLHSPLTGCMAYIVVWVPLTSLSLVRR